MGFTDFFNGIKDGLGSAVNWVTENSGTIAAVAGTVAKVAGAVLLADDVDEFEGTDDVARLQQNYNIATQYLEQQADSNVAKLVSARAADPSNPTQVTAAKLSGVWTEPSFNNAAGQPQVTIAQDMSKFLDQQCMPSIYKTKTGKIIDIAHALAAAAFADETAHPAVADEKGVTTYPISVSIEDEGFSLIGAHSFYHLPMGQGLQDDALHSCISLHCATTREFRVSHAKFRKAIHAHAPEVLVAAKGTGWLTTFEIVWTAGGYAINAWPKIQAALEKLNPAYGILYSNVKGNIQTAKIQAPENVTPAKTKSDLTDVISKVMIEAMTPPAMSGNIDGQSNTGTQLPAISIAGTTINFSSTETAQKPIAQQNGVTNGTQNNVQEEISNPTMNKVVNIPDGASRGIVDIPGARKF